MYKLSWALVIQQWKNNHSKTRLPSLTELTNLQRNKDHKQKPICKDRRASSARKTQGKLARESQQGGKEVQERTTDSE